jgi:hypothetical protein
MLAHAGKLAAGNHNSIRVDHAHRPINAVFHLVHDSLEHPAGHTNPS